MELEPKIALVQSIYRATGAFPTLEMSLKTNSLNEDQWGQLRYFADLINQANFTVKTLEVKSENLPKVQELITKMNSLGNRMLKLKKVFSSPFPEDRGGKYLQQLTDVAREGTKIMTDAENLADSLRKEFQKKKYIII